MMPGPGGPDWAGMSSPSGLGGRSLTGRSDQAWGLRVGVRNSWGTVIGDRPRVEQHFHGSIEPVVWPVRVGRPPLPADAFLDRPWLMDSVTRGLSARGFAVGTGATSVLTGDGGTGKTQLAVATWIACTRAESADPVDLAVWVTATSRSSILTGFAAAARRLRLSPDDNDPERNVATFLDWLEGTHRRWLIVLDDVTDPTDLSGLWPTGPAGSILLTTRSRDAALTGRKRHRVDVEVFTASECLTYLSAKLAPEARAVGILDEVVELGDDLGRLPLALAQAAAVISNDALTCGQYRALLADRARTLAELLPTDAGDEHLWATSAVWALAIDRADALAPIGAAGRLAVVVSLLDPNGIPEAILTSIPICALLSTSASDPLITAHVGPAEARRVLRNLHRFSLIVHDPTAVSRSVRMHALAQRAIRENADARTVAAAAEAAADALTQIWLEGESDSSLSQALCACTSALAISAEDHLWSPSPHPVFLKAGESLRKLGLIMESRAHWEIMVSTATRVLGPDHASTLTARVGLAQWRAETGDPAHSVTDFQYLLKDLRRVLGFDHPETLRARIKLACARGNAGDPVAAVAELEGIFVDLLSVGGPDQSLTLEVREHLARFRGITGDLAAAISTYEDLLVDVVRIFGPDHSQTLDLRDYLAQWKQASGDSTGAIAALEGLLVDRLRIMGADHPATLDTRYDLAFGRGLGGDLTGALRDLENVLADMLRILGPEHSETFNTIGIRFDIARWKLRTGDFTGATGILQELLDYYVRVFGPDHPRAYGVRSSLAHVKGESGNAAAAVEAFVELLADVSRAPEVDPRDVLAARANLAHWQGEAGDPAGALATFQDLLSSDQEALGTGTTYELAIASLRGELAHWRGEAGDPSGAASSLEDLVAEIRRIEGPWPPNLNDVNTLGAQCELARWRGTSGHITEAILILQDVLKVVRARIGSDHPLSLLVRREFGHWQGAAGQASLARTAFEELLADSDRVLGPDHPDTLRSRFELAHTRGVTGDPLGATMDFKILRRDAERVFSANHPVLVRIHSELDRWQLLGQ